MTLPHLHRDRAYGYRDHYSSSESLEWPAWVDSRGIGNTVCACIGITMVRSGVLTNGWTQDAESVKFVMFALRNRVISVLIPAKLPAQTREVSENCM